MNQNLSFVNEFCSSMQKMEAEITLNNRRHSVDRLHHELESQTLQVLQVCKDFSRDLEDISKNIQTTIIPFQSFKVAILSPVVLFHSDFLSFSHEHTFLHCSSLLLRF